MKEKHRRKQKGKQMLIYPNFHEKSFRQFQNLPSAHNSKLKGSSEIIFNFESL